MVMVANGGRRAWSDSTDGRSMSLGKNVNPLGKGESKRSPIPWLFKKMKSSGRSRSGSCPESTMNAVSVNSAPWGSVDNLRSDECGTADGGIDFAVPEKHYKDRKERKWNRRLLNFKDEVEKAYARFKTSVPSFREGCETLRARLSPSRDLETTNSRSLYVELQKKQSRSRSSEDFFGDDTDELEQHNNFPCQPSLVMQSLAEGQFEGLIYLYHLPSDGDIIVRIGDSKLEFFLHRKSITARDHHHTIHRPYKVGELDLPIFIDSMSLQFSLEDDTCISVEGFTKNFLSRRLSVSTDDLRVKLKQKFQKKSLSPLSGRSPMVKRKVSPRKTIWYDQPEGTDKDQPMRDRAYTR